MADVDWDAIVEEKVGSFTLDQLPPTLELPALPHAVTEFTQKSSQPNVDIKELAGIVETDAGLTVEVLRYVNSTFVGLQNKAKSVAHALTMLGLRQTKTFVLTTGARGAIQARQSKLINQAAFWNVCLQRALFAKEVAKLLRADVDVAFSGALLQDYLLPVLTNDLMESYVEFMKTRDERPINLCEFEQAKFKWDHALAGACLARRWKLPADLTCCILFHHHGLRILGDKQLSRTPVAAVALSAMLPDQLRQTHEGLLVLAKLQEKWAAFDLEEIAEKVDAEHAEVGLGVRNDYPLSRHVAGVLGKAEAVERGASAALIA